MSVFKGFDVLTFAVEIEKNGKRFYALAANQVKDQKVRELFLALEAEEGKHITDFENLFAQASGSDPAESYDGEYIDYVKALVDNHVFKKETDVEELAKGVKDAADAIDLALRFEKDSILFFSELKNIVVPHDRKIIEELVNQEHEHIRRLANLKQTF